MTGQARRSVSFLRRALRDQATVGAVAPTSAVLARTMVAQVETLSGRLVVELGAGTGAISRAVGPRLGPGTRHVAVERDPAMLAELATVAPWALRVPGDAAELITLLREADVTRVAADAGAGAVGAAVGTGEVDVVLCSLPWSYFAAPQRARLLEQIARVLAPDGVFATIAYRPTRLTARSRAFRADLGSAFAEVTTTATVWRNIPPARIYVCRHPSAPAAGSPTASDGCSAGPASHRVQNRARVPVSSRMRRAGPGGAETENPAPRLRA